MRKKSSKQNKRDAILIDFKNMGEKASKEIGRKWQEKFLAHQKLQLACDMIIPLDTNIEEGIQEALEAQWQEREILDDLDAVRTNVERKNKADAEKDAKIAEQEDKIAKLEERNETLQDKLVGKQTRTSSKTEVMDEVSKLCREVCEDDYPNPVRFKNFRRDDRLHKILDEKNCDLTVGTGLDQKITRHSKNVRKLKACISVSEYTVEDIIRRANRDKYPKRDLQGRPQRQEVCRLVSKPKKPKAQPQMTSTNEEDWSSKSKPTIIKAPKDADHDLN